MAKGTRVGEVTHFYQKISVAVLDLKHELSAGDTVHFLGAHTDFRQIIQSMEIDRQPIEVAQAGSEVAVKVKQRVRGGDSVYLLEEDKPD
jgi:putative protease